MEPIYSARRVTRLHITGPKINANIELTEMYLQVLRSDLAPDLQTGVTLALLHM